MGNIHNRICPHSRWVEAQLGSADLQGKSITIRGPNVRILTAATTSDQLRNWVRRMCFGLLRDSYTVYSITLQDIDMFGKKVGFLKFAADIRHEGNKLPGIVFSRGNSVAILLILFCPETRLHYAVLTSQARVPVGRRLLEIPAGMFSDDEESFCGVAASEIQEEIGLTVEANELFELTSFIDPVENAEQCVFLSPGACDEGIKMFVCVKTIEQKDLALYDQRATGKSAEGEYITVRIVPLTALWRSTCDAKTFIAVALYNQGMAEGEPELAEYVKAANGPLVI